MRVMKRLLVHFVQAKLLLQQPIPPKTFGFEEARDLPICSSVDRFLLCVCIYLILSPRMLTHKTVVSLLPWKWPADTEKSKLGTFQISRQLQRLVYAALCTCAVSIKILNIFLVVFSAK